MREANRNSKDCYRPHARVWSYLARRLAFEKRRKESREAGKTLPVEETQRRSLDTEKVDVLNNYIFPSMANLVKFIEYSQEDELRETFADDIKELFFGRSQTADSNHNSVFQRFLQASANWEPEGEERSRKNSILNTPYKTPLHQTVKLTDFRLELVNLLYYVIGRIAIFDAPKYLFDDKESVLIVKQDYARLGVWIRLLTRNADLEDFDSSKVSRPVLF